VMSSEMVSGVDGQPAHTDSRNFVRSVC